MSLELLKLLGHQISETGWKEDSIRTVWCLCCLLFFGSFRIGELLSNWDNKFDMLTTLVWGDIKFFHNSVRIHVRFPKIFSALGVKIDIFEFKGHGCCPVTCLSELRKFKEISEENSLEPVFKFESGVLLTPQKFNSILRDLLFPILGKVAYKFSSHSFRAAIPSLLASCPDVASNDDIMNWGRWDSNAYLRYTRLKLSQRKSTFEKICSVLSSQVYPTL